MTHAIIVPLYILSVIYGTFGWSTEAHNLLCNLSAWASFSPWHHGRFYAAGRRGPFWCATRQFGVEEGCWGRPHRRWKRRIFGKTSDQDPVYNWGSKLRKRNKSSDLDWDFYYIFFWAICFPKIPSISYWYRFIWQCKDTARGLPDTKVRSCQGWGVNEFRAVILMYWCTHLKMDGWKLKDYFPSGKAYFNRVRTVSFREGYVFFSQKGGTTEPWVTQSVRPFVKLGKDVPGWKKWRDHDLNLVTFTFDECFRCFVLGF